MECSEPSFSPVDSSSFEYAVGIDIGSEACSFCVLKPDKCQIIKPTEFVNAAPGFSLLTKRLEGLGSSPGQILVGLEATSRYGENLYHYLENLGYHLCLLHPRQTHNFAQQRGLRAKTDKLDANTIARLLLSGEARHGYVPSELITTSARVSPFAYAVARRRSRLQKRAFMLFFQSCFPKWSKSSLILVVPQHWVYSSTTQAHKR